MASIRLWDPKNPRKAKNISQDEWQRHEPQVELYRQNGHTLKEVVELLREEHGFIISFVVSSNSEMTETKLTGAEKLPTTCSTST